MIPTKRIALIAHDNCKADLADWAAYNRQVLKHHQLFATGTTGSLIAEKIGLPIHTFASGPLGGDLQIGAAIVSKAIDVLIFFWDPLQSQPHDVDVKALLQVAVLYNIAVACNRTTADFLVSSSLFSDAYQSFQINYGERLKG